MRLGVGGLVVLAFVALSPALAGAQGATMPTDEELARLAREATARAQALAVAGGSAALADEIARELSAIGQYRGLLPCG